MKAKLLAAALVALFIVSGLTVAVGITRAATAQTLTVGIVNPGPIETLNPFYPGGQSATANSQLLGVMYLSLLSQDPNGTVVPQLAQSWTVNSNATVFTFTLRQNLKWSDGQPLTANDVVFTFNAFIHNALLDSFNGFIVGPLIKNVSASVNNTEVQFTLYHSFSPFLEYAGLGKVIVPAHIWSHVSNMTNFSNAGNPVGDGPFVVTNWVPGSSVINYKPNPYYYGPAPKIGGIAVQILSSTSNIASLLQTGSLALAQPATNQISALTGVSHMHLAFSPGNAIFGTYFDPAGLLMFDDMLYPYNITQVRQAIAYAINRTQIVQLGLNGYGTPGSQGQLPNSLTQWIPNNLPNYTFDPAHARQMLLGLGFKNGTNGFLTFPNGTAWTPKILDTGGANSNVVSVMVQNLQSAGIDASESVVTIGSLVSGLEYGTFDMVLLTTSRPPIPDFVLGVFALNTTTPIGQQELNYHGWTRWTNSTLWNDLQQARQVGTFSAQYQLYADAQNILATQVPLITLYYGNSIWAYSNASIQGWSPATQGYQFPQATLLTSLSGGATSAAPDYTYVYIGVGIVVAAVVVVAAVALMRRRQR